MLIILGIIADNLYHKVIYKLFIQLGNPSCMFFFTRKWCSSHICITSFASSMSNNRAPIERIFALLCCEKEQQYQHFRRNIQPRAHLSLYSRTSPPCPEPRELFRVLLILRNCLSDWTNKSGDNHQELQTYARLISSTSCPRDFKKRNEVILEFKPCVIGADVNFHVKNKLLIFSATFTTVF